jgi:hypothetical protein
MDLRGRSKEEFYDGVIKKETFTMPNLSLGIP